MGATRLFHPAFGRGRARPAPVRVQMFDRLPRRPSWLTRLVVGSATLTWLAVAAAIGGMLHG